MDLELKAPVDQRRRWNNGKVMGYARRLVPSIAALTRSKLVASPLDLIDYVVALPFKELRALPPNRLRLRVGTDQRLVCSHVDHITRVYPFWLAMFAEQAVKSDSTVLDIGCGCGRAAQILRDAYFRYQPIFRGKYIGVDVDVEAIEWCRRNFPAQRFEFNSLDKFSSVYNPGGSDSAKLELPVGSGTVDFVLCGSLFSHLLERDVLDYLQEIHRVLRPGGLAYASFFCIDHLRSSRVLGWKFTFAHRRDDSYIESLAYPEAAVAYEEDFLLRTMRETGFSNIQVEPIENGQGIQSTFILCR